MIKKCFFAITFIATCAISTGASAQKVYKCGSTYSNIPCADAVVVNTDDARSKAQKTQSDKATVRDTQTASAMEKERLQQEARALAAGKAEVKAEEARTKAAKIQAEADDKADEKTKSKAKKKPSDTFTAKGPVDKKKEPPKTNN